MPINDLDSDVPLRSRICLDPVALSHRKVRFAVDNDGRNGFTCRADRLYVGHDLPSHIVSLQSAGEGHEVPWVEPKAHAGWSERDRGGRPEGLEVPALVAPTGTETTALTSGVVIDLAVYAAAAAGRNTLPPR